MACLTNPNKANTLPGGCKQKHVYLSILLLTVFNSLVLADLDHRSGDDGRIRLGGRHAWMNGRHDGLDGLESGDGLLSGPANVWELTNIHISMEIEPFYFHLYKLKSGNILNSDD